MIHAEGAVRLDAGINLAVGGGGTFWANVVSLGTVHLYALGLAGGGLIIET